MADQTRDTSRSQPASTRLFQRALDDAIQSAHNIIGQALSKYDPEGVCVLFSGGQDSSVVLDVCRPWAPYIVHIDTGVGLAATRQFVEQEAERVGLPLIVESGESYREMVLEHGFPGPHAHLYAYTKLKERALRKVRRRFIDNGREQRVLFLSGVRSDESKRRKMNVAPTPTEREGSVVWVNPVWDWQSDEMAAYRRTYDVPVSPVYRHLHMSGECLCGAFGTPEELDEIEFFYPDDPTVRMLRELEAECAEQGVRPCRWGPGSAGARRAAAATAAGRLCQSCDLRLPLEASDV